jgi:hypothetical protein
VGRAPPCERAGQRFEPVQTLQGLEPGDALPDNVRDALTPYVHMVDSYSVIFWSQAMERGDWDWKVTKTSFSRLESDLRQLAGMNYQIYQIVAVQEVKPAKVPFEVVIISRRLIKDGPDSVTKDQVQPTFAMNYSPPAE